MFGKRKRKVELWTTVVFKITPSASSLYRVEKIENDKVLIMDTGTGAKIWAELESLTVA
jgi:hypothetical protein